MTFNHRPLTSIEIPERFKNVLLTIAIKLDKKDIFEQDILRFLETYEDEAKQDLLNWLKDQ